jgi:WD40 repeat protein
MVSLSLYQVGKRLVSELKGHEDAVQCVAFDPSDRFLISGGSDATFRLWS